MTGWPVDHAVPIERTRFGLRRVEAIMGTTFTIDVRDHDADPDVVDEALAFLHAVDRRFSAWLPDSEVSRIRHGEMELYEASADVQEVFVRCEELYRGTDGYFDMRYRLDGTCDPTGIVKGWALERAAGILARGGARNFAANGGGDVVVRGEASAGRPWRLGVRHPEHPDLVAAVVEVADAAVATSGSYERGDHIVDPHTGRRPLALSSVTVVGPSITVADGYATAAFAMGERAIRWLATLPGYAGCAITANGRLHSTASFERIRVA